MAEPLHTPGLLTDSIGRPLVSIDVPPAYTMSFSNVTIGNPIEEMGFSNNSSLSVYIEELSADNSPNIKYDRVFHFWTMDRAAPGRKFGPYYVPYIHKLEEKNIAGKDVTEYTLRPLREVINPRFMKLTDDLYVMLFFSNFSTNLLPNDEYTDDVNFLVRMPEFATNYPQNILFGQRPTTQPGQIVKPTDNVPYYYASASSESSKFIGNPRTALLSCIIRMGILEVNDIQEDEPKGNRVERLYAICEKPTIVDWVDTRFTHDSYPSYLCNRVQEVNWVDTDKIDGEKLLESPSKQIPKHHVVSGIESIMYPGYVGYDFDTVPINHVYDNSLAYVLEMKRVGKVDPHSKELAFDYDNFRPDAFEIKINKIGWREFTQPSITIKRRRFAESAGDPYAYSEIEEEFEYPYANPKTDTHFIALTIEYETVMKNNLEFILCPSSSSAICPFEDCDCCFESYELTFDYSFEESLEEGGENCEDKELLSGSATMTMERDSGCTFSNSTTFDGGDGFTADATMTPNSLIITTSKGNATVGQNPPDPCCPEGPWDDFESIGSGRDDCEEEFSITSINTSPSGSKLEECCFKFTAKFDCTADSGNGAWTVSFEGETKCECFCESEWMFDNEATTETECVFHKYIKSGSCTDTADCTDNTQPGTPPNPEDAFLDNFCDCLACKCQDIEYTFRNFWQEGIAEATSSYELASNFDDFCDFCEDNFIDPCEICIATDTEGVLYYGQPISPGVCDDPFISASPEHIKDFKECEHRFMGTFKPGDTYTVEVFDPPKLTMCSSYQISITGDLKFRTFNCGTGSSSSSANIVSDRFPLDGLTAPIMDRPIEIIEPSLSYQIGFYNRTMYCPVEPLNFTSDNNLVEYVEDLSSEPNLQYDRILHFYLFHGGSGQDLHGPFYVPYIDKIEVSGEKTKYTLKPLREIINPRFERINDEMYVMYFFSNFVALGSSTSAYTDDPKNLKRMHEFAVDDPSFIDPSAKAPAPSSSDGNRLLPLDNVRNYHADGYPELENPKCALCSCIVRITEFEVPAREDSSSSNSQKIRIKYPICERPIIIDFIDERFVTDFVPPALINRVQSLQWATDRRDSDLVNPTARNDNPPRQPYHHDIISSISGKMYPGYTGIEVGLNPITNVYEDSLYHVFVIKDENGDDKYFKEINIDGRDILSFEFEKSAAPCQMNLPGLNVEDDPSNNTPNSKTNTHYIVMRVQTAPSSSSALDCECGSSSFSALELISDCSTKPSLCSRIDWNSLTPKTFLSFCDQARVDFFISDVLGKNDEFINIIGTAIFNQEKYSDAIPGVKIAYPDFESVTAFGSDGELYCLELNMYQKMENTASGCGVDEDWRLFISAVLTDGVNTSLETPCDCNGGGEPRGFYHTNELNGPGETRINGYTTDIAEKLLTVGGTGTMVIVWKTDVLCFSGDGCGGCRLNT